MIKILIKGETWRTSDEKVKGLFLSSRLFEGKGIYLFLAGAKVNYLHDLLKVKVNDKIQKLEALDQT